MQISDKTFLASVAVMLAIWGLVGLTGWLIKIYKKRVLWQNIEDNVVPVDYDQVADAVREMNSPDMILREAMDRPQVRHNLGNLQRLRTHVSIIRSDGYDRAVSDQLTRIGFEAGVTSGPFKKGTGEAKQWVRGYCMGANVTDIKRYYRAA